MNHKICLDWETIISSLLYLIARVDISDLYAPAEKLTCRVTYMQVAIYVASRINLRYIQDSVADMLSKRDGCTWLSWFAQLA